MDRPIQKENEITLEEAAARQGKKINMENAGKVHQGFRVKGGTSPYFYN